MAKTIFQKVNNFPQSDDKKQGLVVQMDEAEKELKQKMIQLWTSFAKVSGIAAAKFILQLFIITITSIIIGHDHHDLLDSSTMINTIMILIFTIITISSTM